MFSPSSANIRRDLLAQVAGHLSPSAHCYRGQWGNVWLTACSTAHPGDGAGQSTQSSLKGHVHNYNLNSVTTLLILYRLQSVGVKGVFGTWQLELAPIRSQEQCWGGPLMLGDKARLAFGITIYPTGAGCNGGQSCMQAGQVLPN